MASETNSTSRYSGNSTGNVWMNDPGEIDPFKKYFTPPDPRMARAARFNLRESGQRDKP